MKALISIITAFWAALSILLGACLIASVFGLFGAQETLTQSAGALGEFPLNLILGILLLALGVLFVFATLKGLRGEQYIAFENPNGEVTISVAAVEDFVYRLAKEFVEIKEVHPAIIPKNEGVSIQIRAILWSGVNIPDITEKIQTEIKTQVQTILGIENIANVEIKVTKIESRGLELGPKTDLFEEPREPFPQGRI